MTDNASVTVEYLRFAEQWTAPLLDKLEALNPDAEVNRTMQVKRLAQAFANEDLFVRVVREYFEKNLRREFTDTEQHSSK
jgi:hypothetical protein